MKKQFIHWWRYIQESPLRLSIFVSVILFIILLFISFPFYLSNEGDLYVQLIAEGHGILADLLVFGVLFSIVSYIRDRKESIKNYLQELYDLRSYFLLRDKRNKELDVTKLKENMYALIDRSNIEIKNAILSIETELSKINQENSIDITYLGIRVFTLIKKLNNLGVHALFLNNINLAKAPLRGINLTGSDLSYTILDGAELNNSQLKNIQGSHLSFIGSILNNSNASYSIWNNALIMKSTFIKVDFSNSKFLGAVASNTKFINCNFSNCNIISMNLEGAEFINCDLTGLTGYTYDMLTKAALFDNCKTDGQFTKFMSEQLNKKKSPQTFDQQEQHKILQLTKL